MTATPITAWRRWRWPAALLVLPAFFADNIYGRLRFEWLCQHDAGWRVDKKLSKGEGILVENWITAEEIARMPGIGYSRTTKDGARIDLRYAGINQTRFGPVSTAPADQNLNPAYRLDQLVTPLPSEVRTSRLTYLIVDPKTEETLARWTRLSFTQFNPDRTILGAPSILTCGEHPSIFDSAILRILFK